MSIKFAMVIGALLGSLAHTQPLGPGPLPQPTGPTIGPIEPILPGPRIESVIVRPLSNPKLKANATDEAPAIRQAAAMAIVVENVGGAESVQITDIGSNCGWVNQPRVNYGPQAPDRGGKIHETRIGAFTTGDSGCTVRATVVVQKHQTSSANPPLDLVSAPFQLTGSRTVSLDTFSKIDDLFHFGLRYGYGVCEGFSDFGAGRFPVGAVADARNDFTIAIRSGPLGTDCRWHSQMLDLPPGVKPIIDTWDTTAAASDETRPQNLPSDIISRATCSITPAGIHYLGSAAPFSSNFDFSRGTSWLPIGPFNRHDNPFIEGFAPIVTSDNVTLIPAETGNRIYHGIIPPLRVHLLCGRTLINDQSGIVTIKSVRFSVPNNVNFP
jgi:hypothetical protein